MIRLIAAIDRRRGIAKGGLQPWKITHDEAYFSAETKQFGSNILVGSRTFTVIGRPLPERRNFVLSQDKKIDIPEVEMVRDLEKFLNDFEEDIWVIGGAMVFEETIAQADELYLTCIDADFGCNQFFPEFEANFTLKEQSELQEENGFIFTYRVYTRSTP